MHTVVLDRMLPDIDGLRVLHLLREELKTMCVHFLTMCDVVEGRIAGITASDDTGDTGSRPWDARSGSGGPFRVHAMAAAGGRSGPRSGHGSDERATWSLAACSSARDSGETAPLQVFCRPAPAGPTAPERLLAEW
ncbi:hypothetical protein [Streptomyces sp. BP-8]|uniref:Response regulator n=1 Tax=Streptomyces sirii TaxID=3127701 RepID=A0ABZ2QHB9_9ACTN